MSLPVLLDKLGAYPHIVNKIKAMYPSIELDHYLNAVIYQDREQIRQGFNNQAMSALMSIYSINKDAAGIVNSYVYPL